MSTSGNSTQGAVSGAGGTSDGLNGPPESSAEGASASTRTRNPPRREPRRVKPLLLAAACVFMAALGWDLYRNHDSHHIAAAEASAAAIHGDDRAEIPLEQQLEQERTLRRDLEQQLAARLAEQEALEHARTKDVEEHLAARQTDQELLARERVRSNDLEQRLVARQGGQDVLANERARIRELERQLAARQGDQDALARERARAKELEGQLAARQRGEQAMAQERARTKELERQLAARQGDQDALAREKARTKELEGQLAARQGDQDALARERARAKELEQQLAMRQSSEQALAKEHARAKELEGQLATRQGDQDALARERARTKELEGQLAARQSSEKALVLALAVERARNQAWQQDLVKRTDATPGGERDAIVRLSAPASDNSLPPAPIERNATPVPVPANTVASTKPPVPPSAANEEVVRLMARAQRLLEQGDIVTARVVLERAASSGSSLAVFALAETYDPAILSTWGTVGTQGDAAKAQELYAKAAAGGVEAAKDRLKTLR